MQTLQMCFKYYRKAFAVVPSLKDLFLKNKHMNTTSSRKQRRLTQSHYHQGIAFTGHIHVAHYKDMEADIHQQTHSKTRPLILVVSQLLRQKF